MFKLRVDNCPCCKFDIFMHVLYSLFAKTLEYNKRKSRSKILDVLHKARNENFRKTVRKHMYWSFSLIKLKTCGQCTDTNKNIYHEN